MAAVTVEDPVLSIASGNEHQQASANEKTIITTNALNPPLETVATSSIGATIVFCHEVECRPRISRYVLGMVQVAPTIKCVMGFRCAQSQRQTNSKESHEEESHKVIGTCDNDRQCETSSVDLNKTYMASANKSYRPRMFRQFGEGGTRSMMKSHSG